MSQLPGSSSNNTIMGPLCDQLKDVTKIVNGGLFTENRDGPTGLEEGGYVQIIPGGGEAGDNSNSKKSVAENVIEAIGSLFRNIWVAIATFFDNALNERVDAAVLYDFNLGNDSAGNWVEGFVQYYQNDYADVPWGNDGGTISSRGCGPTCVAMVVSTLTGREVTPVDIIEWSGTKYLVYGAGSDWALFQAAAEHYGLKYDATYEIEEACKALEEGKLIISAQTPGLFTRSRTFYCFSRN